LDKSPLRMDHRTTQCLDKYRDRRTARGWSLKRWYTAKCNSGYRRSCRDILNLLERASCMTSNSAVANGMDNCLTSNYEK